VEILREILPELPTNLISQEIPYPGKMLRR